MIKKKKKKEEKVKSKVTTKNSTLMFIYFYIKTLFLSEMRFLDFTAKRLSMFNNNKKKNRTRAVHNYKP